MKPLKLWAVLAKKHGMDPMTFGADNDGTPNLFQHKRDAEDDVQSLLHFSGYYSARVVRVTLTVEDK